jgi:hypothetical protein
VRAVLRSHRLTADRLPGQLPPCEKEPGSSNDLRCWPKRASPRGLQLDGDHNYDEFDVASQLAAERGWIVPTYTLPPKADHIKIMRRW